MVSKNQKKLIKSLYQKKYRKQHGLFVAEGKKLIYELLEADFVLHSIFAVTLSDFETASDKSYEVTQEELKSITFLSTPQAALALFYMPESKELCIDGLVVALDDVRDPGNLGTIIRLCDWFGVDHLICSEQTVDCYNPKVVQATMGSITRVHVVYTSLVDFLKDQQSDISIFGTFMDGHNIHKEQLPEKGILVMGNEANGISEVISQLITRGITIPRFGETQTTESLNVATATAIALNEFRR